MKKLSYASTGVNYHLMDPLKQLAQLAGIQTDTHIEGTGFAVIPESKGESAAVIAQDFSYLAFVQEGLGTKNLVADAMEKITGNVYYDTIAQDCVASIINDLITVGARPIGILAYWVAGSSRWFEDTRRMEALVSGWKKACDMSGVAWIGGETPTLSGIINPDTIDLGGSAFGNISPKSQLVLGEALEKGDAIILFESSGIHTNGLSLARSVATQLPKGFATQLPSGRMYGEALLDPTIIYAKVIEVMLAAGIAIHYMVHVTGHGWRKLMRHTKKLTYRMTSVPPIPEVLSYIVEKAHLDKQESYGNLNMGAGFAVFVPQSKVKNVLAIARKQGIQAYHGGIVEQGEKQVIIEPLGITFDGESLQVRA